MRKFGKLIRISALLIATALVSFGTAKIISGDVAFAGSGKGSVVTFRTGASKNTQSVHDALIPLQSGTSVSGFVSLTRNQESLMIGVQLVPMFSSYERKLSSYDKVGELSVQNKLASTDRYSNKKLFVEAVPVTEGMLKEGYKVEDVFKEAGKIASKNKLSEYILSHGTYGMFNSNSSNDLLAGYFAMSKGGDNSDLTKFFDGMTGLNKEAVDAIANNSADVEIFTGVEYDPLLFKETNLADTFIYVPSGISKTYATTEGTSTAKGGINGLLSNAVLRTSLEQGKSFDSLKVKDYYSSSGDNRWLNTAATNLGLSSISTMSSDIVSLMKLANKPPAEFTVAKRQELSAVYSILLPIVAHLETDGAYGSDYTIAAFSGVPEGFNKGSLSWVSKFSSYDKVHSKFVAGGVHYDAKTATNNGSLSIELINDLVKADICNVNKSNNDKTIGDIGHIVCNTMEKYDSSAYFIVDTLFGGAYNTGVGHVTNDFKHLIFERSTSVKLSSITDSYLNFMNDANIDNATLTAGDNTNAVKFYRALYGYVTGEDLKTADAIKLVEKYKSMSDKQKKQCYQFMQWLVQGAVLRIAELHGMSENSVANCYYGFEIKFGEVDMYQHVFWFDGSNATDNCVNIIKALYERGNVVELLGSTGASFVTTPYNMAFMMAEGANLDWKMTLANVDIAEARSDMRPVIKTKDTSSDVDVAGNKLDGTLKLGDDIIEAIGQLGNLRMSTRESSEWVGIDTEYSKYVAKDANSSIAFNIGDLTRKFYIINLISRGIGDTGYGLEMRSDNTAAGTIINYGLQLGGQWPFAISNSDYGVSFKRYYSSEDGWVNEKGYINSPTGAFGNTDTSTKYYTSSILRGDTTDGNDNKLSGQTFKFSKLALRSLGTYSTAVNSGSTIELPSSIFGKKYSYYGIKSDTNNNFWGSGYQRPTLAKEAAEAEKAQLIANVLGLRHIWHAKTDEAGALINTNGGAPAIGSGGWLTGWVQSYKSWSSDLTSIVPAMCANIADGNLIDKYGITSVDYERLSASGLIRFYACLIEKEESGTDINGVLGFDNINTEEKNDITHEIFEPKNGATEEEKPKLVFGITIDSNSKMYRDLKSLAEWYAGGQQGKEPVIPEYTLYYNLVGANGSADGEVQLVKQSSKKTVSSKFNGDWLTSKKGLNLKLVGQLDTTGVKKYELSSDAAAKSKLDTDVQYNITPGVRLDSKYGRDVDSQATKTISENQNLSLLGIDSLKLAAENTANKGTEVSLNEKIKTLIDNGEQVLVNAGIGSNDKYDLKIYDWPYDALFKDYVGDKETADKLKYGSYYGLGMEYYITVKEGKGGKAKNYLSFFKLDQKDNELGKKSGTKGNKELRAQINANTDTLTYPLTVIGSGYLTGMMRESYNSIKLYGATSNKLRIALYRAAADSDGFYKWPGYTVPKKDEATKKEAYNNHMYFKVKKNLSFPVEESAVILWNKNGKHEMTKDDGTKMNETIPSDAHVTITAKFKSQAEAEKEGSNSDDKADSDAEYDQWVKSLKDLKIDAITIYVYNDATIYKSECPESGHDGSCAIASVGTFECDSWTMSRDEFVKMLKPSKGTWSMPVNMVSTVFKSGISFNSPHTAGASFADSAGTRVDYSVKIGYIGIVDGSSLVENKTSDTCNKSNKLSETLTSGKVLYDLLTGEKLEGDTEQELRELGYGDESDYETNKCYLTMSTLDPPAGHFSIIRSHLEEADVKAYATIKEGTYTDLTSSVGSTQQYNVMTGVPSTEVIYYTSGGDEWLYELAVRYVENEKAVRTYVSYFAGRDCKFKTGDTAQAGGEGTGYTNSHQKDKVSHAYNNETVTGKLTDTFVLPEPKDTGRRTSATWKAPEHGGVTIGVTYKGEIKNTTSQPSVVLITSVADNLGVTSDASAINVPRVTGNNKSEGGINVNPGSYYSGYAGEMDILNKQQLAGSAGGTYSWDVSNYNTDLQAAYDWAVKIEAGSKGAGNVVAYSDSDGAVRSWHAGDAEIQVTLSQLNWSSNYPGLNGNLNSEAYVNQAHAAENFKNSSHKWTTDTVMKENKNSGAVLVSNDDALSSGWFEVFGSADIYGGMTGCKPESGTSYASKTRHSTGQPTNTIVVSYTHGNGDEVSWLDWLKDGNPQDQTYTYVDTYEDRHDTSAQPDGSCSDSCSPHTAEFTAWASTWCGKPAETHKDAVHKHTVRTTIVKGAPSCDTPCPGHGTDEDGNPNECTCQHTHYSCSHSVAAGSYTTHTCSQSHSHGGYAVTKLAKADTVKYTITVTFRNTYTDANSAGTDAKSAAKTSCPDATYPAHSCCGPCCSHKLPTVTDNWIQEVEYNYVAIEDISVFKIARSYVKGLNWITYDYDNASHEYMLGKMTHGDPNIWYNIADFNYGYHYIPIGDGYKQQAAAAGRLRYSVQSQQLDDVIWIEANDKGISPKVTYARTGDCDGRDCTSIKGGTYFNDQYNPVKVEDKGHGLTYALGVLYARTIDSFAIYKGTEPVNNQTGLRAKGSAKTYSLDGSTYKLDSIIYNDMAGILEVKGALYGGQISYARTTIADKADPYLNSTQRKWYYYNNTNAYTAAYTQEDGWIDNITTGGEKRYYSDSNIDDKDSATHEVKRWRERRETPVTVTVCSDFLILQTSTGDLPVVFFEKDASTVHTEQHVGTRADAAADIVDISMQNAVGTYCSGWEHPVDSTDCTLSMDPPTDFIGRNRVGGYNGNGALGGGETTYTTKIFSTSGYRSYKTVLDTGDGRITDASVKHNDTGCNNGHAVMSPRITYVGVATAVDDAEAKTHKSSSVIHQKRMPLANYMKVGITNLRLNPVLENGWYKIEKADQTWQQIMDWSDTDDYAAKKFDMKVPMDRVFKSVYNATVGRNVWLKEAVYERGATKINDVIIHSPISNSNTWLNNYDGPMDDQRIIDTPVVDSSDEYCPGVASMCKYSVLSCSYYRDNVVFSMNFEDYNTLSVRDSHGNITSANIATNAVGADGTTKVTDLIKQLKISLPGTASLEGSSGAKLLRLSANSSASGTFAVRLSDIDCTPTTGIKIKVALDYRSTNGNNTIFSIGDFRVYTVKNNANTLYLTDGVNTRAFSISGANSVTKSVSVIMNTDGLADCEVYAGTTKITGTNVGTALTASISPNQMGSYVTFGGVSNDTDVYIDNVVITRLAGRSTHSAACYETVVHHERTEQYACQIPVAILSGTNGAQEFTAPVSGIYTIECYGAQGGGRDMNSTNKTIGNAGGLGGYTKADVYLTKGQKVYAYVGKQGSYANGGINVGGGWNGGGNASGTGYGGGGMTYVSFSSTDKQQSSSSEKVDTIDLLGYTPVDIVNATSGTTSKVLSPGIYYAEVGGMELGTSGFFVVETDTTVYYSVGDKSWINFSNSETNSLMHSGRPRQAAVPAQGHYTTHVHSGCTYYPGTSGCPHTSGCDQYGICNVCGQQYYGTPGYYTCGNRPLNSGWVQDVAAVPEIPAEAGYFSSAVTSGRTGYAVTSRHVTIRRMASLAEYSDIDNVEYTAQNTLVNKLASPSTVVDASGTGSKSLTPGLYYLQADGKAGTAGNGGRATGWLLVKNNTTVYYNTSDSSWINTSNTATNALVLGGKGAVAGSPAIPGVQEFNYTGAVQTVILAPATYTIECYGAQGGSNTSNSTTGKLGRSASVTITVKANTPLYMYVGGKGGDSSRGIDAYGSTNNNGGWNGGGNSAGSAGLGGGGATHIQIGASTQITYGVRAADLTGLLIIAGGGGGGNTEQGTGGNYYASGGNGSSGWTGSYYYDTSGGGAGYNGGSASPAGDDTYRNSGSGTSYVVTNVNSFSSYLSSITNAVAGSTAVRSGNGYIKITGPGTPATPNTPAVASSTYGVSKPSTSANVSTAANVKIIKYVDLSGLSASDIPDNLADLMVSSGTNIVNYAAVKLTSASITSRKLVMVNSMNIDQSKLIMVAGGGGGAGNSQAVAVGHVYDMSGGDGGITNSIGRVSGLKDTTVSEYTGNLVKEFTYTGAAQSITLDPGTYVLEAVGASGGGSLAGTGGTTSGKITLKQKTTLYVYVGGQGTYRTDGTNTASATFNGGGDGGAYMSTKSGHQGGAGGGATDFRLVNGNWDNAASLQSRILVAGGGGGSGCASSHNPGDGGGLIGRTTLNPSGTYAGASASGGSQTAGGTSVGKFRNTSYKINALQMDGVFGRGAYAVQCAAGGGGGYYGGGSEYTAGGGGGSSYVSGYTGCDTTYRNNQKINGEYPVFSDVILRQGGNTGNGVARVYKVGGVSAIGELVQEFGYTGSEQTITLQPGKYILEALGAQGGMYSSGYQGGYGGLTSGIIDIPVATTLHVYVGKAGYDYNANYSVGQPFNGGGEGYGGGGDGGGATDFRLVGGTWNNEAGLKSRILVAGGGGGSDLNSKGGEGGGYIGVDGLYPQGNKAGHGGTQTAGGVNDANASANGRFGMGGGKTFSSNDAGGGGGGYYGGAAGWGGHDAGGGGSSYVSNFDGCDRTYIDSQKINNKYLNFSDVTMETGVNAGDGVARIYKITTVGSLMGTSSVEGGNAGGGGGGWFGGESHRVGQNVLAANISDSRGTSYNQFTKAVTITGTGAHCCIGDVSTAGLRYVRITVYGTNLASTITGLSPCNNYGQKVVSTDITDTVATFIIDKGKDNRAQALNMGFTWKATGAQIYRYTIEGSNSKSFVNSTSGGGGNGGGSSVNTAYINAGSAEFESGVNYGNGMVVITLGTHTHGAECAKTNPDYNTHVHNASCICGSSQSLLALKRAIENAKHNDNWTDICTYLGVADKAGLSKIKSGSNNVLNAINSNTDTLTTVNTVVNIVKAQPTAWIDAMWNIGGKLNPIISCGNIYSTHVCGSKCTTTQAFNCTEPHHSGGHYAKGNEICYEACHNDANHVTSHGIEGVGAHQIADRLQLDDYFSLHWDNTGNFYDSRGEIRYWTDHTLNSARGDGYFTKNVPSSRIDTTRWTRAKVIMFYDIDVIFYNEHTGEWEFHERNKPFYLPVVTDHVTGNGNDDESTARDWKDPNNWLNKQPVTEYNFYLLLENNEFDDTSYKVWTLALNDENTTDTKVDPYKVATDIVSNENVQNTNKERTGEIGNFSAFETCTNTEKFDVVGSIGNLLITDTTDFRYSNFFKQTTGEWEVEPFIKKVDKNIQVKYLGIGTKQGASGLQIIDVRSRPVAQSTGYYNTWGMEDWTESAQPFNLVEGNMYSIITADIRSTYATSDTELVMGYDFFPEITTIGDYNNVVVDTYYYLLDKETGRIIDCDVWTNSSSGYKATYIANLGDYGYNLAINDMSNLTDPVYSLINGEQFEVNKKTVSLNVEGAARQVSKEEIARTQRIDNGMMEYSESAVENGSTVSEVLQYIGDLKRLTLNRTTRTYIGSSYTNILNSTKYNPSGTFNGSRSTNIGGALPEDSFAKQARRWLFTLGLPETAYVVPFSSDYEGGKHLNPNVAMSDGRDPITDLLYDPAGTAKERYVVLIGVDIKAYGNVWTLEYEAYKQPQQLTIAGKTYTLPTSIPDILAVFDLDVAPDVDWDIIKTH